MWSDFSGQPPGVLLSGQEVYASRGRKMDDKRNVPAEVVRREKKGDKEKEKAELESMAYDRRTVLAKKPKDRQKWLQKGMQALSKKEVDANTVFEIISSSGFYDKVTPRMAKQMYEVIEQHWGSFSSRQISLLKSDKCDLQKLVARADEEEEGGGPAAKKARTDDGEADGIERRIDSADGSAYSLDEFIQEYGGSRTEPPAQWRDAAHTSFIFRS
jgi:hypothetical protein